MKLIGIEEHFITQDVASAWGLASTRDDSLRLNEGVIGDRLRDLGAERLRLMDETGVDVQALALAPPGLHNLDVECVDLAKKTNDFVAATIAKNPNRFQGLATLPMGAPQEAPRELERSVGDLGFLGAMMYGRTRESNLDDKAFWPIFEAASALRVPLFLHPQIPQASVRNAYYSGFDPQVDLALSCFALGWHYEAGLQFVRLVLAGVFDRFPQLQVILGHWGEVVIFYAERLAMLDRVAKLKRPFLDYVRHNLYLTASGMFSEVYLRRSIEAVGVDRILFSTDFPYQYRPGRDARRFIDGLDLDQLDKEKFAHGNWARLTDRSRRSTP
jgi:predicted TIM-barrel fold metal-dependent hydrolase